MILIDLKNFQVCAKLSIVKKEQKPKLLIKKNKGVTIPYPATSQIRVSDLFPVQALLYPGHG